MTKITGPGIMDSVNKHVRKLNDHGDDKVTEVVADLSELELVNLANYLRQVRICDTMDATVPLKRILDAIDEVLAP